MRLERINPEKNEYRFYDISVAPTLFSDHALVVSWGRIGRPARMRIARTGPLDDISQAAMQLMKKKVRRGYSPGRMA